MTDSSGPQPIEAEMIAGVCATGTCPTVYRTAQGSLVVQGYAVPGGVAGVDLPEGESFVEIPLELLLDAARRVA
ncbi:hypothetical protein GCM10010168_53710 [Actinoplanes ianthinogenes]|uniref:Uncharacterized protein n=1 Tax=Actinoplanes ianthinogenes TaxID=122358 RepID=A0ABM7LQZ3_9ACTN|nr:hypothetical protein [Actinoplanes ianthinogenes]BCJ41631.1 hypothetical protein Aiant_22880 [Actinoplanes ianthinogenes]GGR28783.1 hypothetical protein GCM10010168_53710 [Actinoplanes ianthinogenes]